MAEITYYYDTNHATTLWETAPAYMIDNILTNYASTNNDLEIQNLIGNTCDGSNLGTITKVELRAYAYGDGDDKLKLGLAVALHDTVPTSSPDWTAYVDVTSDRAWTWLGVSTQEILAQYDSVGKANIMYCAKVEIRVTYTPAAGWSHKYLGVANASIGKICGVAIADIAKVNGVA